MSDTQKQSPLGANAASSLLQNIGFHINPVAQSYMGVSKTNTSYTFGTTVNNTHLFWIAYAINVGYSDYIAGRISSTLYDSLISIGSNTIPLLGNSKPSTFILNDPSGQWLGIGTNGYGISGNTGQGQSAPWAPYNTSNPNVSVTQWGFLRLYALEAWNAFNWNGVPDGSGMPVYKDFVSSFLTATNFISYTNTMINSFYYAPSYLNGVYSNMNDLSSADITNLTLSTSIFGQDCIKLGKAIDLTQIQKFGLPSVLLRTLKKYNAITQSLSLALIASGFTSTDVNNLLNVNYTASQDEEQKIYAAMLIIVGSDLESILIPLNCKTQGLETLADLLNVKKIFPNSYRTLTVPIYSTVKSPVNSKVYYPIFSGSGVSDRINSNAIKDIIGTISIPGKPPIKENTTGKNIQVLPKGFSSYLFNILPNDVALSAGAFSYAMQQVKNIQFVDFEKFAQIVFNIEIVNKNLPLVNGTDVPVNKTLMSQGTNLIALGTGPNKTYTVSDFFGCMSGLPYDWKTLTSYITTLQTTALRNIYQELYLAVSWSAASVSVQYTTTVIDMVTYYQVTGITLTNAGGGYGRGAAPVPTITITGGSGATAKVNSIGTNPSNMTTYGKVISVSLVSAGGLSTSPPSATIQCPPTATLPVTNGSKSTSGANTTAGTTGWPTTMSAVVSAYITQANTEIKSIYDKNLTIAKKCNELYKQFGNSLMVELRARSIAFSPVPVPRDTYLAMYPTELLVFVDSLAKLAQNTLPHMEVQTLEAISNLNTTGGQSIVAAMREARNKTRLQSLGVPLDNTIPGVLDPVSTQQLLCNGITTGTVPSNLNQLINNVLIKPNPKGALLLPGTYPPPQKNPYPLLFKQNYQQPPAQKLQAPVYVDNNNVPIDLGDPQFPGSFAGSKAKNLVPINLNSTYASKNVLPSDLTVQEAIDEVIHCNCDCWIT